MGKKRRTYKKVPDEHLYEALPKDVSLIDYRRFKPSELRNPDVDESSPSSELNRKSNHKKVIPLWAVGWGWNANGRVGHNTAIELREPGHVQKSGSQRYISASTGRHHSLLVTDSGKVFTFGEGRQMQMGLGNPITSMPQKGGVLQAFPRATNPSGELRSGEEKLRDLRIMQAGAGGTFSIAREIEEDEGVALSNGLTELLGKLKYLRNLYPDCIPLQHAWAAARHERAIIGRLCKGEILVWGEGKRGQLGMGRYVTKLPYPRPIPRLRRIRIKKIATGMDHILAINADAELWTWGVGSDGRLGHGDFEDKFVPTKVEFFETYYVEEVSAGDAHSAVLTRSKRGEREGQNYMISTFGRGAHGRLGNGRNLNQNTPVGVLHYPPSCNGMKVLQVSCGGAHTVALMMRRVPLTLANPWCMETAVVCWGYGTNGQLGTGYMYDSFTPIKARLPHWEIISEVAAGRSFTYAKTIGGELFTWGKGLRGQLGQGSMKFSLAPRKLDTFSSFVSLSAGTGHSLCITTPKKYLNPSMTKTKECYKDPLKPMIDVGPNRYDGTSKFAFACCRQEIGRHRLNQRYSCLTCNMDSVCRVCAGICHRGHELVESIGTKCSNWEEFQLRSEAERNAFKVEMEITRAQRKPRRRRRKKTVIESGSPTSQGLSYEDDDGSMDTFSPVNSRSNTPLNGGDEDVVESPNSNVGTDVDNDTISLSGNIAGNNLDGLAYNEEDEDYDYENNNNNDNDNLDDKEDWTEDDDTEKAPYCECGLHVTCHVLPTLQEGHEDHADDADYFDEEEAIKIKSIKSIQGMGRSILNKQQLARMRRYVSDLRYDASEWYWNKIILKTIWSKIDHIYDTFWQQRTAQEMEVEETDRKKYDKLLHTQHALQGMEAVMFGVKGLLKQICPSLPSEVTGEMIPSYAYSWGSVRAVQLRLRPSQRASAEEFAEICSLLPRHDPHEGHLADADLVPFIERYLKSAPLERLRQEKAEEEKRKKEQAEKDKYKKALERLVKLGRKLPPPPPPLSPRSERRRKRIQAYEKETEERERQELERDDGDVFEALRPRKPFIVKRRHSILNPDKLYSRLTDARNAIQFRGFANRRDSLPLNYKAMVADTRPVSGTYREDTGLSLELFSLRHAEVKDLVDPDKNEYWIEQGATKRRAAMNRVLKSSVLSPRPPLDIIFQLSEPGRRRTVAEPERLEQQLHFAFEIRNDFELLRNRARKAEGLTLRRRSFDYGEIRDEETGFTGTLGYQYDPGYENLQKSDFTQFSSIINRTVASKGMAISDAIYEAQNREFMREYYERKESEAEIQKMRDDIKAGRTTSVNLNTNKWSQPKAKAKETASKWEEHYDDEGHAYFFNPATGDSSWDMPDGDDVQILTSVQDEEGSWYWYNNTTGESEWTME